MINVQFSISRDDQELVGDIFDCFDIQDAIDALREVADTLQDEETANPREKGDDDGVEYADPRDERDDRRDL